VYWAFLDCADVSIGRVRIAEIAIIRPVRTTDRAIRTSGGESGVVEREWKRGVSCISASPGVVRGCVCGR
jgi:hypothetical protein